MGTYSLFGTTMSVILKVLLFCFTFLLHQSNGQSSEIRFVMNCLPIEECPTLSWLPESTLSDLPKCGGTTEAPKYKCPLEKFCDCKVLSECNVLNELANARKFEELKNKYNSCGFDRREPKFCCPLTH